MDAELKNLKIDRTKRRSPAALQLGHALDRYRRASLPAARRVASFASES